MLLCCQATAVSHPAQGMRLGTVNAILLFRINVWGRLNAVLVQEAKNSDLLHCNQITFTYPLSFSFPLPTPKWVTALKVKHGKAPKNLKLTPHTHIETALKGTLKFDKWKKKITNPLLCKSTKNSQPQQLFSLWTISAACLALFHLLRCYIQPKLHGIVAVETGVQNQNVYLMMPKSCKQVFFSIFFSTERKEDVDSKILQSDIMEGGSQERVDHISGFWGCGVSSKKHTDHLETQHVFCVLNWLPFSVMLTWSWGRLIK